ncbi:UTP--glucose-1-phosphate uridylyltransferase [Lignipirellula cremea]|uniref:UTP--glucose-1-phosphate uridylyltransferase n=1 Tax=Lignipirellula cremea TaxID=2528010 RepID=A0A518DYC5_9BACT|nr:sugar phosphate nucleotidyltransferase [Lignipirellula cremea]QDU96852.1 UTP--glucose-1-phosphate uridylyltransferase [Lignipirellula cremea]
MTIDIAVVPVAGHGTRLLPLTKSQPKEMLSIGRKPVVQYVVEELAKNGIRRLLFITSHGKSSIEQHFDIDEQLIDYLRETGREEQLSELDFERFDMKYFYTRQRRQLGLGHAVLCAQPLIGDQYFVTALGDSIIGLNAQSEIVSRMTNELVRSGADIAVAFEEVPPSEVVRYGIAQPKGVTDDIFELVDLVEKPTVEEAPSNLAVAARYVFSPRIFEALERTPPGKGGEIQLTDAMRLVLREGGKGIGFRLPPGVHRFDIGNFQSYFQAFAEFALADPVYGAPLREFMEKLLRQGSD